MKKRLFTLLLAVLLVVGLVPLSALAADCINISYDVTYMQTEARRQLDLVNDFRTGDEAYAWNSDNSGYTHYTCGELTWDYNLEKIAMQRAAETAIYSYFHTRPDGTQWETIYSEDGFTYVCTKMGENLHAGFGYYDDAEEAYMSLREDNYSYSGQGHRRSMLNPDWNRFAAACVYYNGAYYWAQAFAASTASNPQSAAVDGLTTVTARVDKSLLTLNKLTADTDSISLEAGSTADLPEVQAYIMTTDTWPGSEYTGYCPVRADDLTWTSSDAGIVSLSGDTLTALKQGSAVLTASSPSLGTSVTVSVSVGSAHTHTYDSGAVTTEATCQHTGVITYTCTQCGFQKTETIPTTEHTYGTPTLYLAPTCTEHGYYTYTCTVCGNTVNRYSSSNTELRPLGHDWVVTSSTVTSCTAGGTILYTCSRCGETKTETVPAGSHNWVVSSSKDATCTEDGTVNYKCSLCGETKSETVPATGHTAVTDAAVAATCTTAGKTAGSHCSVCGTVIKAQTTIPATGHTAVTDAAVAATCTTAGKTAGSHCSACGTVIKAQTTIPATGHSYTLVSRTCPTGWAEGTEQYRCTACGNIMNRALPAVTASGYSFDASTGEYIGTDLNGQTYRFTLSGDVNLDGAVTLQDVSVLYRGITGQAALTDRQAAAVGSSSAAALTLKDVAALYRLYTNHA